MVPHFLQRLELDTTADERAIRRAYAQKLKKIDQEADPAGFQALRSAYDAALIWVRQPNKPAPVLGSRAEDELADVPSGPGPRQSFAPANVAVPKLRVEPPAQHPVEPAPRDDAMAHADTAFASFMDAFKAAAANPHTIPDYTAWQASLEKAMAGDNLISMAARDIFERRFAHLLTQGWKPGHEALFVAATNVFRWNEDRRHLQGLGHGGFILDRALQERALFDRQKPKDRALQRTLIVRLRNPTEPSRKELQSSFALLENVVRNFPTWLGIITDVGQLTRWRELHAALPPGKQAKPIRTGQLPNASAPTRSSGYRWGIALLLIMLVNAARLLGNGPAPQPVVLSGPTTTSKLLAATEPPPAPPPVAPLNSVPADPRDGRPVPRPLSQKAVAALVRKVPNLDVCDEVFKISDAYGLGTPQQDAAPGPAFDRQIVACVGKGFWPVLRVNDAAVQQALKREKARLAADTKKLQTEFAKMRLDRSSTYQPAAVPRVRGIFKDSGTPSATTNAPANLD